MHGVDPNTIISFVAYIIGPARVMVPGEEKGNLILFVFDYTIRESESHVYVHVSCH